MFDQLINRWWIVAARGIVAVVFGLAALAVPEQTLFVLVSLFGMFALADGFFTLGAGLSAGWLFLFLEGVLGGSIGLLTLFYRATSQAFLVELIVAWAFVTGVLELEGAFALGRRVSRTILKGEWLLAGSGVLSLAFGVLLAIQSDAGSVALMWTIGGYAIMSGVLLVALALNIRRWPLTVKG